MKWILGASEKPEEGGAISDIIKRVSGKPKKQDVNKTFAFVSDLCGAIMDVL